MSILRASETGTSLVVCSTCKFKTDEPLAPTGERGGSLLANQISQALSEGKLDHIGVEPMACLFACSQHCAVHLRAPGKIGYVMGSFEPSPEAAAALVEFAQRYDESPEGVVPYRLWPEGVKGHFLVRVPPQGMITTD